MFYRCYLLGPNNRINKRCDFTAANDIAALREAKFILEDEGGHDEDAEVWNQDRRVGSAKTSLLP